ncbi:MAG TPA: sialidase family protein [Edaphobacter sp.]|uniref:sialidase family protein n=1 Tax=Edaphobacter sp. TaxID=1934404 RepID=UPI002B6C7E43|nr:sialidase family protein [Edaphobacter sp.]HUZ97548.1 sialidase family protein [Edaphobacter sp.]
MTRSSSTNHLIAISLSIVAVLVIAFLLWQHTRPLIQTGHQAFVFESHPHALGIEAKRPIVAATVTGGLYLLAVEDSALTLRMSHDSGEHWMPATPLSTPGNTVNTSAENAPQLVARGMYAFALWQQKGAADQTQLVEARSTGMGTAPPLSTIVTDKPATDKSYSGFATLAVAPNGDVYAAWLDGRDNTSATTGTFNIYLARSTDRGATFHHNVKVASLACPCCRPSVAIAADGTVYVAYRHVYGDNERDIAVATSTDHGEHFGPAVRVANDHWKLFGCPESGPVTAAQGNKLIVAWYTATGEHPGIRMAASHDGGQTFSKEISVSDGIENANHPYLSMADDGTIALVFSGRQATKGGDWNSLTPYALRIDTSGHVSATAHVPADASGERYPTASLSPDGDIYVVWSGTDATHASLIRGTSH